MPISPWTRATHASIIATEMTPGFRVTIYRHTKPIASTFFKVEGGFDKYKEKIDTCYAEAKRYAAGYGVN